jgi:hypothetical protein
VLADLRPVRTRRPARVLACVAAASLASSAAFVWKAGIRGDLANLPPIPFGLYVAAALSTFLALLWCALIPAEGQVLSSGRTSAPITAVMLGSLVGADLAIAFHPFTSQPHHALSLAGALAAAGRCLATSLGIAAAPLTLGLWSLRRVLLVSGWRVLSALGGAAGALGGLVLQVHCAISNAPHIAVVHGTALVLPAAVLALVAPGRFVDPRRPRYE